MYLYIFVKSNEPSKLKLKALGIQQGKVMYALIFIILLLNIFNCVVPLLRYTKTKGTYSIKIFFAGLLSTYIFFYWILNNVIKSWVLIAKTFILTDKFKKKLQRGLYLISIVITCGYTKNFQAIFHKNVFF